MRVRRGQVITPRRKRMIHAYTRRHMWVRQAFYFGTLSGVEYLKFKQWEKEFLNGRGNTTRDRPVSHGAHAEIP